MNKTAHFIVTIHNKQDLIERVLQGIVQSCIDTDYAINVICVLDGCTDNTEKVIDTYLPNLPIQITLHKLYQNDVHEILATQHALEFISTIPNGEDDIILFLQDDVILEQDDLLEYIDRLYETVPNLGYLSFRLGCFTNLDQNNILYEHTFYESTFGHWKQLGMDHFTEVGHLEFVETEVVIKSPVCIKKRILDHVGYYDLNLAPYAHDDLDLSIRLNQLGYRNGVFGAKMVSKVEWGGTRSAEANEYQRNFSNVVHRNKLYLTNKHKQYYASK